MTGANKHVHKSAGKNMYSAAGGRADVHTAKDPKPDVHTLDRRNVQIQHFRPNIKRYLDAGEPFIIGDFYHARAIVIPLRHNWRGTPDPIEEEAKQKFSAALKLIPRA